MQFEEFDKKIKEAAEHHHPSYEEKAWDKMEKLLDKHLPVEKDDKRRIIFFLLFLLLGGLGVYLGISKPWQSKKDITNNSMVTPVTEKNIVPEATNTTNKAEVKTNEPSVNSSSKTNTTEKVSQKISPSNDKTEQAESSVNNPATKSDVEKVADKKTNTDLSNTNSNSIKANKKIISGTRGTGKIQSDLSSKKTTSAPVSNKASEKSGIPPVSQPNDNTNKPVTENKDDLTVVKPTGNDNVDSQVVANNDSVSNPKLSDIAKAPDETKKEEPAKKQSAKPGKQKKSAFALTFTAGPDLSTVGLKEAGKVKLSYGAGISYTLNKFTVRSGFYFAKKVYTAGPDDYHPPKHYWTYYVDLTKIDANCRVYEIPLTVSYTLSERKTHNWFASAGLSSFLMKKETYGYYYKYPGTTTSSYKEWTLTNGENHVFSIVNLSAGYERKINNTISVIAEPYFKVPLDGIGFGSIKLNSAGVLFTLSVKPFAIKK